MTSLNTASYYNTANSFSSCAGSQNRCAKSATSVETTTATASSGGGTACDVAVFSPEGLEALQRSQSVRYCTDLPEPSSGKSSQEAIQWAFGIPFTQDHGIAMRSDRIRLQAQTELSERILNERIGDTLQRNGIQLDKSERLDFSIDQSGKIKVGEGIDKAKREKIEAVLNGDSALAEDLLLYYVRQSASETKTYITAEDHRFDSIVDTIIYGAYERSQGREPDAELADLSHFEFELEFSYVNGKIFRGDEPDADRLFSSRIDALESVSLLVGLDEPTGDFDTFVEKLGEMVDRESEGITTSLTGLMSKVGLEDVKKKLTFAQDAEGRIVIREDIRADLKKELENLINNDEELSEQIKNLSAKMDILAELTQATEDKPDFSQALTANDFVETFREFYSRPNGFDLSSEKLAPAREQLMKSFLKENGVSLNEVSTKSDSENGEMKLALFDSDGNELTGKEFQSLQTLLKDVAGLEAELVRFVDEKTRRPFQEPSELSAPKDAKFTDSSETKMDESLHSLVSLKRGELSKANDETKDFGDAIQHLRKLIGNARGPVADLKVSGSDEQLEVLDVSFSFDERGNIQVENIKTNSNNDLDNDIARNKINQGLAKNKDAREFAEKLAEQMFAQHDDEHGDVEEFKHKVHFQGAGFYDGFEFLSPEADAAALKEMDAIGGELAADFNKFFNKTFNLTEPFNIYWDVETGLSLDGDFAAGPLGSAVNKILNDLNERYLSDDPFNDDLFENRLDPDLEGTLAKLFELKEAHGKLHDPELRKTGMVFTVAPR